MAMRKRQLPDLAKQNCVFCTTRYKVVQKAHGTHNSIQETQIHHSATESLPTQETGALKTPYLNLTKKYKLKPVPRPTFFFTLSYTKLYYFMQLT